MPIHPTPRAEARDTLLAGLPREQREQVFGNLLLMAGVPDRPTLEAGELLRLGRLVTELGAQDVESGLGEVLALLEPLAATAP